MAHERRRGAFPRREHAPTRGALPAPRQRAHRYRVSVLSPLPKRFLPTATAKSWQRFQAAVTALRDALVRDDGIREVERTRQRRYRPSRIPWRRIPFYRENYDTFIRKLQDLERDASPGETPPDWHKVLREHRTQDRLRRDVILFTTERLPQLEALPGRRHALVAAAGSIGKDFLDSADHADWTTGAERLTADAQQLLDNAGQYGPHLQEAGVRPAAIQKALDPVRQTLTVDRETRAVLADWRAHVDRANRWHPPERQRARRESDPLEAVVGRPPFFEAGHDALIERVRAAHEAMRQQGETVREFSAALREHWQLNATQQHRVDPLVERIRARTGDRRQLLEAAASDPRPFKEFPELHAAWERLGQEAEAASGELLAEAKEFAPHLHRNPAGWPTGRHSRFEVFASQDLGGLPARHLLRLHDHGAAYADTDADPYLTRGLADILKTMRESLAHVHNPSAARQRERVERAIEPLEIRFRVRQCPDMLRTIAQDRAALEDDAARKGSAVVDLPGYPEWRKQAKVATWDTRMLLLSPAARPALERWPHHEREMSERLKVIEAWLRKDGDRPGGRKQLLQKQELDPLQAERAPPAPKPSLPEPKRHRRQSQPPTNTGDGMEP